MYPLASNTRRNVLSGISSNTWQSTGGLSIDEQSKGKWKHYPLLFWHIKC